MTRSGFCGDVALVQCTSPKLDSEWITEGFKHLSHSPIVATSAMLTFKPTAIYHLVDNVYVHTASSLPPASVARQRLPPSVRITGAVTCFHTDALDHKSIFDDGVLYPLIVGEEDSLDVDTKEDLSRALA